MLSVVVPKNNFKTTKKKRKSFHLWKSHVFDMTRFEGFIKTISLANKFITNALLFG